MLVLTAADVSRLFTIRHALDAARTAAVIHVLGRATTPRRQQLTTQQTSGEMLVMPGTLDEATFGMKLWYRFDEVIGSIPQSNACILLLDSEHGEEVLLDGGVITDLRTGALTGVAAQHLARPDASTVGVIGAGIQARTQVLALVEALPTVRTVRVWSRSRPRLESFVLAMQKELEGSDVTIEATGSAQESARRADVIVAATTSSRPVIDDGWVSDGALVCGVGSHDPGSSEIETATVARAERVVVDTMAGGVDGAGDIAGALHDRSLRREDVVELGALLTGEASGRETSTGVTVFKSVGFATADVVAAQMVVGLAKEVGAGTRVDLHGK
jgi:ornithine cyclodeaminase/alanine dehydrogenase-like protein (mu-crystallin family)